MVEPQSSIVRFDEASLGRHEPKTNRTGGKAREKPNRHPHGEVLLDNADAVIDALHFLAGGSRTPRAASIFHSHFFFHGTDFGQLGGYILHQFPAGRKLTNICVDKRFGELDSLQGEEIGPNSVRTYIIL